MTRWFKDPSYIKWRKEVYKRDNFTCQWPGCSQKRKLNAHHIRKWADFPGLRFLVDNGITLCFMHHKMIKNMEEIYESVFNRIVASKKDGRLQ